MAEQMGNIGSKVSRALRWKGKEKPERMIPCVERALELIDLSIRWRKQKRAEKRTPAPCEN